MHRRARVFGLCSFTFAALLVGCGGGGAYCPPVDSTTIAVDAPYDAPTDEPAATPEPAGTPADAPPDTPTDEPSSAPDGDYARARAPLCATASRTRCTPRSAAAVTRTRAAR
jgi:hypothetical protein